MLAPILIYRCYQMELTWNQLFLCLHNLFNQILPLFLGFFSFLFFTFYYYFLFRILNILLISGVPISYLLPPPHPLEVELLLALSNLCRVPWLRPIWSPHNISKKALKLLNSIINTHLPRSERYSGIQGIPPPPRLLSPAPSLVLSNLSSQNWAPPWLCPTKAIQLPMGLECTV